VREPPSLGRGEAAAVGQPFQVGIADARDYLRRVTGWAQAQQVVLYIHNMFDDQHGVDASSPFNYHFGLIDHADKPKGILFCPIGPCAID
jgi:hypothetical protein